MPTVEGKNQRFSFLGKKRRASTETDNGEKLAGSVPKESTEFTSAMKYIHDNQIGGASVVRGPFGEKPEVYADYTASGRSLYNIENYISKYVLSNYGNTHTSTSFCSLQTAKFRDDAREIIRKAVNANDDDVVIFCGSGTTAAIHKLIGVLGLTEKSVAQSAVVFIGPYEHHSNILPWRETGAKLVRINENRKGQLDQEHLLNELTYHSGPEYSLKVATFSSCSNVTGLLTDTVTITQLLHRYGVLSFWDYASGAPYLKIDMNPRVGKSEQNAAKDAIFCSPHKFVGGPGSPGLLIAKKSLFRNVIPHGQGGGTVLFVTSNIHRYVSDIEAREEGGTPAIIESIRAGLAFQMKDRVGSSNIHRREEYLVRKGINSLHGNPNIILLGSKTSPRIPIFSFVVRQANSNKLLHHNYVSLLLSDLFGIQARGGCACAGPYAQTLLGFVDEVAEGIMWLLDADYRHNSIIITEDEHDIRRKSQISRNQETINITNSLEIMKPGFTRINLAYFMTDQEVDYILSAVNIVATEGWRLLPQYSYDAEKGCWQHRKNKAHYRLMSLHDIIYKTDHDVGMFISGTAHPKNQQKVPYSQVVAEAKRLLANAQEDGRALFPFDEMTMKDYLPQQLHTFAWFMEPHHAMLMLNRQETESLAKLRTAVIPLKPREASGPAIREKDLPTRWPETMPRVRQIPSDVSPEINNKPIDPQQQNYGRNNNYGSFNSLPGSPALPADKTGPDRVMEWLQKSEPQTGVASVLSPPGAPDDAASLIYEKARLVEVEGSSSFVQLSREQESKKQHSSKHRRHSSKHRRQRSRHKSGREKSKQRKSKH